MKSTVMVVGNTGVGKSSFGNRLLGFGPQDDQKPFFVAGSGAPVTERVQEAEGTWFGQTPGSKLVVVDTPGLGDPGTPPERPGALVDTENMAAAGRYLDDNPVNAIVIVVSAIVPRVDYTLARLIHIVVGKLHPKDYNKIVVAVNAYGHAVHDVAERVANNRDGLTEIQSQEHIKNEVLRSFQGCINVGAAPNFDPVRFKNRVFLLNSSYLVATGASDAEAFDAFRDMCMSLGEIHGDDLTQGVLPIHPELRQALDALEESKALENHHEMLERMCAEAAAARQALEERHHEMLERMCAEAAAAHQAFEERHQHQYPSLRRSGSMQAPNQGSVCSIM